MAPPRGRKNVVIYCVVCTKDSASNGCICKNPKCTRSFAMLSKTDQETLINEVACTRLYYSDGKVKLRDDVKHRGTLTNMMYRQMFDKISPKPVSPTPQATSPASCPVQQPVSVPQAQIKPISILMY